MNQKHLEIFTSIMHGHNISKDIHEQHAFLTGALYHLASVVGEGDETAGALLHIIADNLLPTDCYPLLKAWALRVGVPWNEGYDRFHSMEHTPVECEADFPSLLPH